ncbi:hypothetical protein IMG5_195250 [Ichthyophthirius multifiliis]|uniref:CNNM transmembrane domain-containing protein n=1 Tax=Ichthyophthirius multifiliis TaxID=5932 RepID=G0R4W8_ICHMU|nr:hypothetical protein IMG5_195250 [Ichthyophthirius multifiliis]EGR27478.1 hypothetical protein IMG5_195250 [Ichthyophthirius multifiliis]|eukprot:XP_004024388.1 hypothetical protein IMG5_195250 [Ichthyophthirius multifiliis]
MKLKISLFLTLIFLRIFTKYIYAQSQNSSNVQQLKSQIEQQSDQPQKQEQEIQNNKHNYDKENHYQKKEKNGETNDLKEVEGQEQQYTPDDFEFYLFIFIATFLVLFAGICSGLTVGYLSINDLQLEIIMINGSEKEKKSAKAIGQIIKNHHLLLSTLLLSNAFCMEALPIFLDAICPAYLAILISAVAVVIVGEIIPQAYCIGKYQLVIGEFFVPLTKILIKFLCILTYPISIILDKVLGVHEKTRMDKKEIIGLVELQEINKQKQGNSEQVKQIFSLTKEEIELTKNTMLLRDQNVCTKLIPYNKIFKFPQNQKITKQLIQKIAKKSYSSIVIYDHLNDQNIIGILKAKSLINYIDTEIGKTLIQVIKFQEPIIITKEANMLELLMIFTNKQTTVALVSDTILKNRIIEPQQNKGNILGLVSLKDVFECMISKEFQDEDKHLGTLAPMENVFKYKQKMDQKDYHFKFRFSIIGDKSVGKTSFMECINKQYKNYLKKNKCKAITQNYGKIMEQEQSDELNMKTVGYMDVDTFFKIAYWEIPGQQRNQEYFYRYCLGASAAIYIFDISRRQTFERIENWIQESEKCEIPIRILVGNKVDLYSSTKGAVQKSEALGLAKKYGMEYFETCSIGDSSISLVYDYLFTTVVNSIPNPPTPQSLIGKGILLGKRLLNSAKYQLALCDIASLYE